MIESDDDLDFDIDNKISTYDYSFNEVSENPFSEFEIRHDFDKIINKEEND